MRPPPSAATCLAVAAFIGATLVWPATAEGRAEQIATTVFGRGPGQRLATARRLLRTPRGPADVLWARRLLNFDAWRGHGPSQLALGIWLSRADRPLRDRVEGARWLRRAALTGQPEASGRWREAVNRLPRLARRLAHAQAASIRIPPPGSFSAPPARPAGSHTDASEVDVLASVGEAWAQTTKGHGLARRGVPAEAATWWFRAAAQGDRLACANLAHAFEAGEGVPTAPLVAFGFWCVAEGLAPETGWARYPGRAALPSDAVARVRPWLDGWRASLRLADEDGQPR